MSDVIIRLDKVGKIYNIGKGNSVIALKDVTLEVNRGDSIAIMGVSGSGKTTLLNVIGCMDNFTSGSYAFEGAKVENMNANELAGLRGNKIGFVLQDYGLLPRETVLKNVEMPLYFSSKMNGKAMRETALDTLSRLGIENLATRKVSELSGGQKQRVAIARAIVKKPTLLLADEPTGALDSVTAEQLMQVFDQLNSDGITVIMVTHDVNMAKHMKRLIYIKDGEIHEG